MLPRCGLTPTSFLRGALTIHPSDTHRFRARCRPDRRRFGSGLARPDSNITGFTAYDSSIGEKWLEVLKKIAPRLTQVLVLVDPQNPTWMLHVPTMEKVAPSFAVQLTTVHVRSPEEIERAIDAFAATPNAGMIVLPSVMTGDQRDLIIKLASRHRMPAIYALRAFVASGGLIYYSSDWVDLYRRAASYVDRILKGAKPGDLPVQQPVKFELIINLKTAKALGLIVPPPYSRLPTR